MQDAKIKNAEKKQKKRKNKEKKTWNTKKRWKIEVITKHQGVRLHSHCVKKEF